MFIDLNVPIPAVTIQGNVQSKKQKGKQPQQPPQQPSVVFTPAQLSAIETRIDLLIHLGYTVLALNQTVQTKVDPKTHVNVLDPLLRQLRKRTGLVLIKRLTIILDEDSEKGFGLTTGNASLFTPYDLIALTPTTATTFSLACLSHTQPSPLTAHIISLPLTLPRLPFNLKHTLVGTALKNGAVFEISYVGALGGEGDPSISAGGGDSGAGGKRNWWAASREVVRVTKGKGIIVTGGGMNAADLRAPRDVGNLITILGLGQERAHDASTKTPKALILRAQTRKTYRAVFSEPKIVIPDTFAQQETSSSGNDVPVSEQVQTNGSEATIEPPTQTLSDIKGGAVPNGHDSTPTSGKKRARNEEESVQASAEKEGSKRKKKKMKSKEGQSA